MKEVKIVKRIPTLLLKFTVVGLGSLAFLLCAVGLPLAIRAELRGDFDYGFVFIGLYFAALPFMYALLQAYKVLEYIDNNMVFSPYSVRALRRIKLSAAAIGGLFAAGMPYIFHLADRDDAPGVAAIGFVIIFSSFVITTAAAVFERLMQSAVEMKSENDLTV